MSVTFINQFVVPDGRDEAFLTLWRQVNEYMCQQPGYVAHRLGRAVMPNATHRFANIATWESQQAWQSAHDQRFRALVSDPAWREFPSTPTLYEPVHSSTTSL